MFRRGMWVKDAKGRVAILNSFDLKAAAGEVHVVDAQGQTTAIEVVPLTALRQAGFKDIPQPRRPTKERGALLGYK